MWYILRIFFALRALAEPNSWQEITPVGSVPTPKRINHMVMWSEIDDGFYVYGGRDENYALKNDLHFYSRQTNSWAEIVPNGSVPARQAPTAVWSNQADGFYVFGGCCWENDLHFYSRESNSWEKLSPAGTLPLGREGHASVWGDVADGFYVCGGYQSNFGIIMDLAFYSRASNAWQRLWPTGSPPDARYHHTLVWSEIDDGFYLFGGYSSVAEDDGGNWGTFQRNDLYLYSRQANSWQKLEPSGMPYFDGLYWQTSFPSRREEHAAVWSKQNDGFYVFGGYSDGYYMSDVYLYSRQRNEWQAMWPTGGNVEARHEHAIVGNLEGFYVVGGRYSTSAPYDDLFLYIWQTTTTTTTYTSSTQTTNTSTSSTFTWTTMTSTTMTSSMTTLTSSTSTVTTLTHTSSTTTWTTATTTATSTWTLTSVQDEAASASGAGIKLVVILAWLGLV
ncbi:unnamed protein product [Cladocopium goreaui]|uniref:Rab9 effector protein with kelch motifs n=1 Tax=Cladocopium goreaui TaxID=2562237 RepID=A0A9P1DHC7_9DINO|nr:unnamed protein product [Cladocopium goreaui]